MSETVPGVVPLRVDLSDLVRRSVATLYSNLVTRPTGQALRLGIESQIVELGPICVSVLDFTEVVVLDYSCADETVAKLIQRYQARDRPANAYFVARGVGEHHRETLEAVLVRHSLLLVAEEARGSLDLLGSSDPVERRAWEVVEEGGAARADDVARLLGLPLAGAAAALARLAEQRVVVPSPEGAGYHALSRFLPPAA